MTADWDGTAFTLHGSGGKKAYMELEPGDYTFVCFNDRLEEKDGALVIAKGGEDLSGAFGYPWSHVPKECLV